MATAEQIVYPCKKRRGPIAARGEGRRTPDGEAAAVPGEGGVQAVAVVAAIDFTRVSPACAGAGVF